MKNIKKQLLILSVGMLASIQAHSATVEFRTDTAMLKTGETIELSIFATGFSELAGGIIDFGISAPSYISDDDILIDSRWDLTPEKGALRGNKWEGLAFDAFGNEPLNGDGLIATVNITGVDAGKTTLTLLDSSSFFSKTTQLATSEIIDTSGIELTVESLSAVPLPASVWFLGSAFFGLMGLRKKRL